MTYFFQSLLGPNGLILLGAFISTIGVIWASNQQSTLNNGLLEKSSKIIEQSRVIEEKSTEIEKKNIEIINKSDQLIEKSEKISQLNEEIVSHTTGGDSYPKLIVSFGDSENKGYLIVSNGSLKYNMFELQMRIADLDSKATRTLDNIVGDDIVLNVGNVPPSSVVTQGMIDVSNTSEKSFNIFSQTRNNSFIQHLRLKKVSGVWLTASRVSRWGVDHQVELLKEEVDEGFPLNAEGLVDW